MDALIEVNKVSDGTYSSPKSRQSTTHVRSKLIAIAADFYAHATVLKVSRIFTRDALLGHLAYKEQQMTGHWLGPLAIYLSLVFIASYKACKVIGRYGS